MKIEVKTYEESRLEFFKDLARKAEKKLDRCIKAMKKSDYNNPLSEAQLALDDACEKKSFYCDVVDMLCLERKETNIEAQIKAPLEIQRIDFKVNDKQMDEMRKLADEMGKAISTAYKERLLEDEKKLEEVLKANGWRKASEVAEEIIADLVKFANGNEKPRLINGHIVWFINSDDLTDFIAEFKKKYTENGK